MTEKKIRYREIFLLCMNWHDSPGTYTVLKAFSNEETAKQQMEKFYQTGTHNPDRTFLSIVSEFFDDED